MRYKSAKVVARCLGLATMLWSIVAFGQGRITQAVLGTGITEKNEIVNPTSAFKSDIPKIYCAWKAEGVKTGTSVRGVWIAEDVGKAAPPNYRIDQASVNLPFVNQGKFALSKPNKGFPLGKYRLEIYLGNTLAKTLPFTVTAQ